MSEDNDFDISEWEQVSFKKILSFSFGWILVFFLGGQFNVYVFYYYNVEVGLPVVLLGLAFIIFALWNAINDPLIGYLTDRPFRWTKKWGMRFPWILAGGIPLLICWYLTFAVPESLIENSNPWPLFLYFLIVVCALDTFYTIYTTHIGAAFTTHFRTDAERRRASAVNTTLPNVLALIIGLMVPLFYVYGNRETMIFAMTIVVILLAIALIITIPGIRESEDLKERFLKGYIENPERDPYFKLMKEAFRRKSFAATLLCFMLLTFGATLAGASNVYFFKDILGIPFQFAMFTGLAYFLGMVGSIPFWSNMSKKYGHAKTMKISFLLMVFSYLPGLWITTLIEAIIFAFTGGIVAGAFWVTLGPVVADVYDECTIATGKHQEATYEAFRAFFNRLSFAFVGIVIPIIQIITAYNPDPHAIQTPLAIWGIRVQRSLIPSLLALIAFIIMHKQYDLIGEKQVALKKKLKEMGL
jgi:GPH family glycoside/pentoside/hexuronide:cation symporter